MNNGTYFEDRLQQREFWRNRNHSLVTRASVMPLEKRKPSYSWAEFCKIACPTPKGVRRPLP